MISVGVLSRLAGQAAARGKDPLTYSSEALKAPAGPKIASPDEIYNMSQRSRPAPRPAAPPVVMDIPEPEMVPVDSVMPGMPSLSSVSESNGTLSVINDGISGIPALPAAALSANRQGSTPGAPVRSPAPSTTAFSEMPSMSQVAPQGSGSYAQTSQPQGNRGPMMPKNAMAAGIAEAANAIGIDPVVLATVISYETAGTFDPMKNGPRTQWGQHKGLIQWGEPQAIENGVDWNDPVGSQLGANGAIVRYLRKAGVKPGMGLLDVYSAVNAGRVGRYNASDANNGGAPGTVQDKVNNQMAGHYRKALDMFGMQGDGDFPGGGTGVGYAGGGYSGDGYTAQNAEVVSSTPFNAQNTRLTDSKPKDIIVLDDEQSANGTLDYGLSPQEMQIAQERQAQNDVRRALLGAVDIRELI